MTQNVGWRVPQVGRTIGCNHQHRRGTIGDQAAVRAFEGFHHRGGSLVLIKSQQVPFLGVRRPRRVRARRDGDFGQVLGARSPTVHVPLRGERVNADGTKQTKSGVVPPAVPKRSRGRQRGVAVHAKADRTQPGFDGEDCPLHDGHAAGATEDVGSNI